MRTLKWVGSVLAILFLAFFAVGVFFPSVDYESRVMVARARGLAWDVFTDERNLPKWITNFKSLERISGQPHEVGSKYRMIVTDGGKEFPLVETTTAFAPPERYAFHLDAGVLTNDVDIRFIERGERTEIVAASHLVGANPFWRSLFRLTKSTFMRNDQVSYDKLKRIVEGRSS